MTNSVVKLRLLSLKLTPVSLSSKTDSIIFSFSGLIEFLETVVKGILRAENETKPNKGLLRIRARFEWMEGLKKASVTSSLKN